MDQQTYNFCTLFDRNYFYKGLALHASLREHCRNFTLWILCMDNVTLALLRQMNLPNVKLVSLEEFETPELKKAKQDRTAGEYAWTCGANLCKYMLDKYPVDSITYLDSDLYFFGDPEEIFQEIDQADIAIIEHRYAPESKHLEKQSGRFNVEWVTFKNNEEGRGVVNWWSEKVLEWCYARFEDGKFGDQLYLNDWPERFRGVYIIRHKGAGLAPWNVLNYQITKKTDGVCVDNQKLIFYHFHTFHLVRYNFFVRAISYKLSRPAVNLIYRPYMAAIRRAIGKTRDADKDFNFGVRKFNFREFFGERVKTLLNF